MDYFSIGLSQEMRRAAAGSASRRVALRGGLGFLPSRAGPAARAALPMGARAHQSSVSKPNPKATTGTLALVSDNICHRQDHEDCSPGFVYDFARNRWPTNIPRSKQIRGFAFTTLIAKNSCSWQLKSRTVK